MKLIVVNNFTKHIEVFFNITDIKAKDVGLEFICENGRVTIPWSSRYFQIEPL